MTFCQNLCTSVSYYSNSKCFFCKTIDFAPYVSSNCCENFDLVIFTVLNPWDIRITVYLLTVWDIWCKLVCSGQCLIVMVRRTFESEFVLFVPKLRCDLRVIPVLLHSSSECVLLSVFQRSLLLASRIRFNSSLGLLAHADRSISSQTYPYVCSTLSNSYVALLMLLLFHLRAICICVYAILLLM